MELTKEQKMDIVSKAIDAGFHISLNCFAIKSLEEFDEKLNLFTGLEVEMNSLDEDETAYAKVNNTTGYLDKFEAILFLD